MRRFGGRQDWGWRTSEQKDMHALVLCSRYGEIRPPNLAGYSVGEIRREARSEGSGLASHCGFPFDAFICCPLARNHRPSSSSFVIFCRLLQRDPGLCLYASGRAVLSLVYRWALSAFGWLTLVDCPGFLQSTKERKRRSRKTNAALDVHGRVQGTRLSVELAIRSLRLL